MPDPLLTADDLALRPGGGVRSPWLRDALAAEGDPPPLPGLSRDRSCDVAIVGGGYTGLWTALQLKERAPEREVVLLEQDICGGGPSGRNGGFVNAWWDELDTLEELYGAEPAISAARALSESVRAIGAWCEQHDVDAHYRHAGMLVVSTTAPHDDRPLGSVAVAQRLGVPEEFVALTPDEVQARCASPRFRNGAFMRDGATVQPALLARGLRRVALERGVVIHEQSRARPRLERDGPRTALLVDGPDRTHRLTANQVVLAVNAWGAGWRPFHRSILAWGSYMVALRTHRGGAAGGAALDGRRVHLHGTLQRRVLPCHPRPPHRHRVRGRRAGL